MEKNTRISFGMRSCSASSIPFYDEFYPKGAMFAVQGERKYNQNAAEDVAEKKRQTSGMIYVNLVELSEHLQVTLSSQNSALRQPAE